MRRIHRSPVNSPHKGQWRGALMFSLICTRINDWVNNVEADDLRRHRAYYDVIVMYQYLTLVSSGHNGLKIKCVDAWKAVSRYDISSGFRLIWGHVTTLVRSHYLIFSWTKWPPFRRRHFQVHFCEWRVWIWIKIQLKFVPRGLINNIPALVQIMAWHRSGDKPLFEPMLTQFTDACMRH